MAITDNVVAAWHLNNDALDAFGSTNGTVNGATFDATTKKLGSHSAYFDGTGDYIEFAHSNILQPDAWSLSYWIYPSAPYGMLISMQGGTNGYSTYFNDAADKVKFLATTDGVSWQVILESNSAISADTWYHVVITFESGSQKMYIDGVLQSETASATGTIYWDTSPIKVGALVTKPYDGYIDAIVFFNVALTQSDVDELWNSGTGIELEPPPRTLTDILVSAWPLNNDALDDVGSNDGTVNGATFDAAVKKVGSHSGSFDGTGDYISVGNDSSLQPDAWSLSYWLYASAPYGMMVSMQGGTNGYSTYFVESTDKIRYLVTTDGATWGTVINSNDALLANTWYHLVVTFESGSQKMYIDGVLQTEQATASSRVFWDTSPIKIGALVTKPYDGRIDAIAFFNAALTQAEVDELWNSGDGIELGTPDKGGGRIMMMGV